MKEYKISADEAKALWRSIFRYTGFSMYVDILEEHGLVETDYDTGAVVGDEYPSTDELLSIITTAMAGEPIGGEC